MTDIPVISLVYKRKLVNHHTIMAIFTELTIMLTVHTVNQKHAKTTNTCCTGKWKIILPFVETECLDSSFGKKEFL